MAGQEQHDDRQPTTENDSPWRVDDVGWRPADDGVVLYDGAPLGLHQLNGPAAMVWQLLDAEVPLAALIDDLADATGAPAAQVHDDVLGIVDALRLRGLVRTTRDLATTDEVGSDGPPDVIGAEAEDEAAEPRYLGVPPNF